MKLIIFIIIVTALYGIGLFCLIRELKAHPSPKERKENQSYPLIIASTILYLAIMVQIVRFVHMGVLTYL